MVLTLINLPERKFPTHEAEKRVYHRFRHMACNFKTEIESLAILNLVKSERTKIHNTLCNNDSRIKVTFKLFRNCPANLFWVILQLAFITVLNVCRNGIPIVFVHFDNFTKYKKYFAISLLRCLYQVSRKLHKSQF